jgi:hypothetical protein
MLDTYELALVLCGMNPDDDSSFDDEAEDKVSQMLYDKYSIDDSAGFDILVKDLAKLVNVAKSELTGNYYRGFSHPEKNEWLYKELIK